MATSRSKKPSEKTICVCLVTDYAVSVAVVRKYSGSGVIEKPVVLYSSDILVPLHERDLAHSETFIVSHAKKLLETCRSFHGKFDDLVCVLGNSWVKTVPRSIHIEKNNSFKVTQKIVDEALVRDMRLFEQEMSRDLINPSEFGIVGNPEHMIDINGYRVNDWAGSTAKTLDIYTAISIAEARFVGTMIGVFADVFHLDTVRIESMDHARIHLFPSSISGTVLDLGALQSTISIIDRGVVVFSSTIPAGIVGIEQGLVQEFAVTRSLVASVMRFATDEKLTEHDRDVYYQRIKESYQFFSQILGIATQELVSLRGIIPEPLVVMAHPFWISVFHPLIESGTKLKTFISDQYSFDQKLLFSHAALCRSSELCLAVLQAI